MFSLTPDEWTAVALSLRIAVVATIVAHFPADSHPEIVYPVAATVNAKPDAPRYIDFLRSQTAKGIFEKYGFSFLIEPTS